MCYDAEFQSKSDSDDYCTLTESEEDEGGVGGEGGGTVLLLEELHKYRKMLGVRAYTYSNPVVVAQEGALVCLQLGC